LAAVQNNCGYGTENILHNHKYRFCTALNTDSSLTQTKQVC